MEHRMMEFVDKLDTIYKTHLIYRTIVVCDRDICEYKRLLELRDFSVYVVSDIDYDALDSLDSLDCRVILIESKRIEGFLDTIISKKMNDFYTFITFTNDNDDAKAAKAAKASITNIDVISNKYISLC
jgi:hypothetical protein